MSGLVALFHRDGRPVVEGMIWRMLMAGRRHRSLHLGTYAASPRPRLGGRPVSDLPPPRPRDYWSPYTERMPREQLRALQLRRLQTLVGWAYARSPFWRQLLANILGKPVVTLETQEGSASGAALLAMVGTGIVVSLRRKEPTSKSVNKVSD